MTLSYDRYCAEIVAQTEILADTIKGGDLTRPVPSCPGWNVGQLLRHLGGAHRSAVETIRGQIEFAEVDQSWRDLSAYPNEDPAVVGPWLVEGATELRDTLVAVGEAAPVPAPVPDLPQTTQFHSRRMAHETVIHRADATLALGAAYTLDPAVAVDGIDEWLELGCLPFHFEYNPALRDLIGPGNTLHLHATDTPAELRAEWVLDLTGDVFTWRRAHEKAKVAVRAPLTDLLLLLYRRRPATAPGVDILGDREFFDTWHAKVSFG
ncbi:maleylpyruvate isomerase family mycothiol-dependent enzyme [Flindersiella endophytica]